MFKLEEGWGRAYIYLASPAREVLETDADVHAALADKAILYVRARTWLAILVLQRNLQG